MKIVCVSDTHNSTPDIPECDLLLHAGDMTNAGTQEEILAQLKWLKSAPARHKVLVPGNHDWLFMREPDLAEYLANEHDVDVLINGSMDIEGLTLCGFAWHPAWGHWAFEMERDSQELEDKVLTINTEANILVTHAPPLMVLDQNMPRMGYPQHVGCKLLAHQLLSMRQLRLHVFGHIHEGYGITTRHQHPGVLFVNASHSKKPGDLGRNAPVVVHL